MNKYLKVKIIDKGYKLSREIFIVRYTQPDKTEILRNDKWEQVDPQGAEIKPTLELLPEELQELAEALSENGFKPREGFLEGKLGATEKHLEDMRKLVFKINP